MPSSSIDVKTRIKMATKKEIKLQTKALWHELRLASEAHNVARATAICEELCVLTGLPISFHAATGAN